MYRMIKAVGNDGIDKLSDIKLRHSLEGDFYYQPMVNMPLLFIYYDNSGQMMRTSLVQGIVEVNGQLRITTENSAYWFEEVQ